MSHQYKVLPDDQLQDLFSTFLIDSWSYSKVAQFARNEKAFEMQHIYGLYSRLSVSSIAGNAYHTAVEYYFTNLKDGLVLPLPELEAAAFQYLNGVPANKWKLGKSTPTVEEAIIKATKTVTSLIRNFYQEKSLYEDDIAEILFIELKGSAWVTCNGVDIPLPCHFKIDMICRLKTGGIVIIDHKSKSAFTDEDEAVLSIGVQAMTYVLCFEEMKGMQVEEVWFMENKYSQNTKGGAQLVRIPVKITPDTRRLYEALLYEPVKRMIGAVRDPDYIYLINESDNFVDKAELYDFWCRTMLNEFSVDSFNIDDAKKELVSKRLKKVRDSSLVPVNPGIIRQFKENASKFIQYDLSATNMTPQEKIEHAFKTFGKIVRVAQTFEGYSSNTFLLEVSAGVKVGDLFKYRLDVANALDVANVRFSSELVRFEGKSYVSFDIDKQRTDNLLYNPDHRDGFKIPLGKDNFGRTVNWDMDNQSTPHMMVCGATGSGKSVFMDCVISYAKEAGINNIIILDVKKEFGKYAGKGVDVINNIQLIEDALKGCVDEMNKRIDEEVTDKVLVVFDEYPDAVERARKGPQLKRYGQVLAGNFADGSPKFKRECVGEDASLSDNMSQLLAKGRSSGFRVIIGMQRASTQIISGDMKNNMPVRVCFSVQKVVDSQVVLDEAGAEKLQGKGDGLLRSPEYRDTVRFQAYYKPSNVTA
jgi:S-DNA-T family DNA segregation ATPase FtsK/SpoIIIE